MRLHTKILAAIAAIAVAGCGSSYSRAGASTVSNHPWISFEAAVSNIYKFDSVAAKWAWGNPSSLVTCQGTANPCTPDNLPAASADRFTSEATFAADVSSIPSSIKYVVYDIEDGNGTPSAESADAPVYMKDFNQIAVAHGLVPVITPAQDNGNDATWCPKQSGETNATWSVRCNLWGRAAAGSQGEAIVVVQTQSLTANLTAFDNLYNSASQEILNWFASTPKAKPYGEISTTYGTAAQEEAAAKSISGTDGLYYSFSSGNVSTVSAVLRNLQAANW